MTTYDELEDRVAVLLHDLTALTYSRAVIEESLRTALMEYSRRSGSAETLQGLDGADQTSVPAEDTGILVLGAAGFAASAKALDRLDAFNLNAQLAPAVAALGERFLERFTALLGMVRSARMRAADVSPWGSAWG